MSHRQLTGRATRTGGALPASSSPWQRKVSVPSNQMVGTSSAVAGETSSSSSPSMSSSSYIPSAATAQTRLGGPPLVLAPVSQLPKGPRRTARNEPTLSGPDRSKIDPEQHCIDGTLRTMHKIPHFDQSYAQAMQARYIRHSRPVDREQELSIQQIFDKK